MIFETTWNDLLTNRYHSVVQTTDSGRSRAGRGSARKRNVYQCVAPACSCSGESAALSQGPASLHASTQTLAFLQGGLATISVTAGYLHNENNHRRCSSRYQNIVVSPSDLSARRLDCLNHPHDFRICQVLDRVQRSVSQCVVNRRLARHAPPGQPFLPPATGQRPCALEAQTLAQLLSDRASGAR